MFGKAFHIGDTDCWGAVFCSIAGGLRIFLKNRKFELYFLCYGMQYGLLSGILSLWASYLSLCISNRMLVLASLLFAAAVVIINFVLLRMLIFRKIRGKIYE